MGRLDDSIYIGYVLVQVDKEISPEVVRSVLTERANWPCLATKSAHKVSYFCFASLSICLFPSPISDYPLTHQSL